MIKLKHLLIEDDSNISTISQIDLTEVKNLLQTKCSKAYSAYRSRSTKKCFFRGIKLKYDNSSTNPLAQEKPKGFLLADPSRRKERRSLEHPNIFNFLMKRYRPEIPDRTKSLIYSTSYRTAKMFGDAVYAVFPFDESIYGYSEDDFIASVDSQVLEELFGHLQYKYRIDFLNKSSSYDQFSADLNKVMEQPDLAPVLIRWSEASNYKRLESYSPTIKYIRKIQQAGNSFSKGDLTSNEQKIDLNDLLKTVMTHTYTPIKVSNDINSILDKDIYEAWAITPAVMVNFNSLSSI